MNKPESVRTLLQPIFKDAMDWGRSYGQRLNLSSIDVDIVSDGYAEKAEQAVIAKLAEKAEPFGYVSQQHGQWLFVRAYEGDPSKADQGGYKWSAVHIYPPTTAALVEAAEKAAEQMERARNILTEGNPRPECNWGMLDPSALRAAIEAHKGKV